MFYVLLASCKTQDIPATLVPTANKQIWEYTTLSYGDFTYGPLPPPPCIALYSPNTPRNTYECIETNSNTELITKLNELGSQGWELVSYIVDNDYPYGVFFFKRAK